MNPVSRVLVVSDDAAWQADVLAELAAVAGKMANPFGLCFEGVGRSSDALARAASDGEVQIVLVDKGLKEKGTTQPAVQLANQINRLRPELSLYILLQDDDEKVVMEELASHAIDGYFYRDERDFNGWFRIPGRRNGREGRHAVLRQAQAIRTHGQGFVAHARPRRWRLAER